MSNISIIGSGKVGIAVGMGFQQLGNKVVFYDTDEVQVKHLGKLGHVATSNLKYAISESSLTFVCVPTPSHNSIDLSHVISAVTDIATAMKNKPDYQLAVMRSTLSSLLIESCNKMGGCSC